MPSFPPLPRLRRVDPQERRNLNTGMRKLYDPVRDDSFDDLLKAIARRAR